HGDRQIVQAQPFDPKPVLKGFIADPVAFKEVSAIKHDSLVELSEFSQPLELDGIDCNQRGIEAYRVVPGAQGRGLDQRAPQVRQRLSQTGPRLLLAAVA